MTGAIAPLDGLDQWARGQLLEIVLFVLGAILLTRLAEWARDRIVTHIDANARETDELVRSEASKHRHVVAQVVTWAFLAVVIASPPCWWCSGSASPSRAWLRPPRCSARRWGSACSGSSRTDSAGGPRSAQEQPALRAHAKRERIVRECDAAVRELPAPAAGDLLQLGRASFKRCELDDVGEARCERHPASRAGWLADFRRGHAHSPGRACEDSRPQSRSSHRGPATRPSGAAPGAIGRRAGAQAPPTPRARPTGWRRSRSRDCPRRFPAPAAACRYAIGASGRWAARRPAVGNRSHEALTLRERAADEVALLFQHAGQSRDHRLRCLPFSSAEVMWPFSMRSVFSASRP